MLYALQIAILALVSLGFIWFAYGLVRFEYSLLEKRVSRTLEETDRPAKWKDLFSPPKLWKILLAGGLYVAANVLMTEWLGFYEVLIGLGFTNLVLAFMLPNFPTLILPIYGVLVAIILTGLMPTWIATVFCALLVVYLVKLQFDEPLVKSHVKYLAEEGLEILKTGTLAQVEELILFLAAHKEKEYVKLGLKYLDEWGDPDLFTQLTSDDTREVTHFSRKELKEWPGKLDRHKSEPFRRIETLAQEGTFWKRVIDSYSGDDEPAFCQKILDEVAIPEDLKEIYAQQRSLFQSYPRTFSMKHNTRGEIVPLGEGKYIRCPISKKTEDLVMPEIIIGEIGGVQQSTMDGTTLKLPLWTREQKKTTFFEVDEVHIFWTENQDWAIAATLEKIRNEHPDPLPPLKLTPGLKLSVNSRGIVNDYNQTR